MCVSCTNTVPVYVKQPLVVDKGLVTPVKPEVFTESTDLVEYTIGLLAVIERMNNDRVTLGKSIEVHNGQ